MKILVAPDKFKGSLGARDVAAEIAAGLRESLPAAAIETVPVADGGEGTADVMNAALQGKWLECPAHDALGRQIDARYLYIEDRKLAVMEMAEAAGRSYIAGNSPEPLRANTFGVGEMILHITRRGATRIIVGLGGSATNDGGFGMARALDYRFFAEDEHGQQLRRAISKLAKLDRIDEPANLVLPTIIAAADVRNPLLGGNGATRVFARQKGATDEEIELLERALTRLADEVTREFGFDYRDQEGAGAAGGLGFGLMSFCGAVIQPGFEMVAELLGLEAKIRESDIVVTGEGKLDGQTLEGKAPAGVADLAKKFGKPVYAIVGELRDDPRMADLFDRVHVLARAPVTVEEAMRHPAELIRERARELAEHLRG
jgi:glycerate 2-kinase